LRNCFGFAGQRRADLQTFSRQQHEYRRSHQAGAFADSQLKINASGTWIADTDLAWEINESDAYALEAALQLKRKAGRPRS